jgi:anti-sigma factor RsiW
MNRTPPTLPHPSADDLVAFAQGSLDSARAAVVEVHLSQCAPCAVKVAAVPDDGFIRLLKAAQRSNFANRLHNPGDQSTHAFSPKEGPGLDRLPPELRQHPRYKIERLFAAGAMGEVYLAADAATSTRVAVKVLKPELAGNPARKRRFLQEAHIAARLRHPNVVKILHSAAAGE